MSRRFLTDDPAAFLDLFNRTATGPDAVGFWVETEGRAPAPHYFGLEPEMERALLEYMEANWRSIRDGRCIASRSNGSRCSRDTRMSPFCWQHEEGAFEWFDRERFETDATRHLPFGVSLEEVGDVVREARDLLERRGPGEVVYFYELVGQGVVKIGTTRRVAQRIASFRTGKGCTFPPDVDHTTGRLIGTTPGGRDLEQHLHRVHHRARIAGEWFRLTDEVADHIDRLITPTADRESA